jgi:hypothetical protein
MAPVGAAIGRGPASSVAGSRAVAERTATVKTQRHGTGASKGRANGRGRAVLWRAQLTGIAGTESPAAAAGRVGQADWQQADAVPVHTEG